MERIFVLIKKYRQMIAFILLYTLFFYVYTALFGFLLPITAGALLAAFGYPICRKINRLHMIRKCSSQITTTLLAAILTVLLFLLLYLIWREAQHLYESLSVFDLQKLHPDARRFIENTITSASSYIHSDTLKEMLLSLLPSVSGMLRHLTLLPAIFMFPVLSFLFCSFFLKYRAKIKLVLKKAVGSDVYSRLNEVIKQRASNGSGLIFSYAVIYLSTFAEACIVLFLFDIRYPLLTALAVTVSDVFPILGPGIIFVPLGIYKLLCGNYAAMIGLLVGWITITVIRQIIEPRLISKVTKTPGFVMLFAFYAALLAGNLWIIPYIVLLFFLLQLLKDADIIKSTG